MSGTKCWHFKFWLFSLGYKPFRSFNISTKDLKGFKFSSRRFEMQPKGEHGKGNTIFLDGSSDSMKRTMQELMSISKGGLPIEEKQKPA